MAEALSLVERGWRGARDCSLVLGRRGDRVLHLVKGRVAPDVLAMIAPAPGVHVRDVPRSVYRAVVWVALLVAGLRRHRWVVADNPRTVREIAGWCRALGLTLVQVEEQGNGYELRRDGRAVSGQDAFGAPWGLTTSSSK